MYEKRIKVFIAASLLLLVIGVSRLVQMQLLADSSLRDEITALKEQRGRSRQLKTLRGRILDRHGNVLATDIPQFQIAVDYRLTRYCDRRVTEGMKLLDENNRSNPSGYDLINEIDTRSDDISRIVENCTKFGVSKEEIAARIQRENNKMWNLRTFLAWLRNDPDPNIIAEYAPRVDRIPLPVAKADFKRRHPDARERAKRIMRVDDLREMYEPMPLLELKTEDDIFAAQLEFMDINDVDIIPKGERQYPYGSVASQTIGWVGAATQERDKTLFEDDPLAQYLEGEICGRQPGVEYACEQVLRGRRGELVYDIDRKLVRHKETEFGKDVQLTLDIELQQQIETYLRDPMENSNADANMAAVVIDVPSGDILALVSLPTFNCNRVGADYAELISDSNHPLLNRAIAQHYPPGSSIKPVVLIAGLETGVITPDRVISCPSHAPPSGWPKCWIYRDYGIGHDEQWNNNARNAIKGSCNVYFSHLANEIEPDVLQSWFFRFGYGHALPLACPILDPNDPVRRQLRQVPGQIASTTVARTAKIESVDDLPELQKGHRPLFGIGQSNFRATPLQVANAFATLARGGRAIPPRLFLAPKSLTDQERQEPVDLQISSATLQTVYEGMDAVVNEPGGTAHKDFPWRVLAQQGVKVLGKTGSTERPYHAWFAGFAQDQEGAKVAFAIVVEGGAHGSSDAAPLAGIIVQLCVDKGYVGAALSSPAEGSP